jgi:hypothetical protein
MQFLHPYLSLPREHKVKKDRREDTTRESRRMLFAHFEVRRVLTICASNLEISTFNNVLGQP